MNPILETIKQREEEGLDKLRDLYLDTSPDKDDFETKSITMSFGTFQFQKKHVEQARFYLVNQDTLEEWIKSFHTASLIAVLQAEVEWLKGEMFVDSSQAGQFGMHADGMNQAFEETIAHLEATIEALRV